MSKPIISVLFVCLGNICRSPTAHGVFREYVNQAKLSQSIDSDSCGTGAWHVGESPDARAAQAASTRGFDLSDLRGRQLQRKDFDKYDYILAMDANNLSEIEMLQPANYSGVVDLFLRYAAAVSDQCMAKPADVKGSSFEVPDPYYGGDDGFDKVLDMIETASAQLLAELRRKHHL